MAKVFIESGESYIVANNNTSVFSSSATGVEKVTVQSGVTGTVVDQNVDAVLFSGASSDYTYQQAGSSIKVYSGTNLVATIPLQMDANGTQLTFSNGTVDVKLNTTTGAMTLGGATVNDSAPTSLTPSTIDSTTTSTGTAASSGQPFTLTVNTDNIAGTSGNDTINAAYDTVNKSGTFNSLDVINGGAGTDTLNIEYGQTINGTITSVEKVFYKGLLTNNGLNDGASTGSTPLTTVDASKVGGLQELWFDNVAKESTGTGDNLAITNLAAGQAVGFKGKITGASTGTDTFAFNASYGTGATTATVALDGASSVQGSGTADTAGISLTLNGSKLDTVAVSGDGTLTLVAGTGAAPAITTLNITGGSGKSANVNVGTGLGTGIKTVTTTGDTKLDLQGLTSDLTYTGGAGKDTLVLGSEDLSAKDVITFGAGDDRLALVLKNNVSSGNATGSGTGVTLTDAGLTLVNKIDVEQLKLSAGSGVTQMSFDVSKFTKAGTLVLDDAGTSGVALSKVVNATKILVEDDGSTGTTGLTLTAVAKADANDATKFDSAAGTVNVEVAKSASVVVSTYLANGSGSKFDTLVLTGEGKATYAGAAATGGKAVTVDATNLKDTLTFQGYADAVESVKLGSGKDKVTLTFDTNGTGTGDGIQGLSTYAKMDTITGLVKGDVLVIGNDGTGTGIVDTAAALVKFTPATNDFGQTVVAAAANAGTNKAAWFQWTDGNTYVVADFDGTGSSTTAEVSTDLVVKLVGSLTLEATSAGISVA